MERKQKECSNCRGRMENVPLGVLVRGVRYNPTETTLTGEFRKRGFRAYLCYKCLDGDDIVWYEFLDQ